MVKRCFHAEPKDEVFWENFGSAPGAGHYSQAMENTVIFLLLHVTGL
jgi:hypothetical protein